MCTEDREDSYLIWTGHHELWCVVVSQLRLCINKVKLISIHSNSLHSTTELLMLNALICKSL